MAKAKRSGRRRNHAQSAGAVAAPKRRAAASTLAIAPSGIVPGALRTLAVLTVRVVEVTQAVLTSTIRGAVTVVQEAVNGVRTIGSDVIVGGSSMTRAGFAGRVRDEQPRAPGRGRQERRAA